MSSGKKTREQKYLDYAKSYADTMFTAQCKISVRGEFNSFTRIEYKELKETVDHIVNNLPEKQQRVFQLSRGEGLSHKEIAEKLNISTKTVEYHICQSISTIKSRLEQLGMISLLYCYFFL